jgi:hypothetical protein
VRAVAACRKRLGPELDGPLDPAVQHAKTSAALAAAI